MYKPYIKVLSDIKQQKRQQSNVTYKFLLVWENVGAELLSIHLKFGGIADSWGDYDGGLGAVTAARMSLQPLD